ncbi:MULTISPECIES: DUF1761 domain-containing protein [Pseudarthrobacter]|uniref:DUF1761 domain-containing protein n=1 Tax=Pseudarthrobacter sulfonivorans TaxID=121292 RepID=A0A0U3QNV1_9MICC|nr:MULTISPECIES: DUF1761 domain-containing protein [Pseudarthrobacter]ALV41269.1 hypothetical protein AU252_09000 [Pseudarthrobacter sulfonivorans]
MAININWLAVLLAALASFIVGGLWYSVLFAKVWQREAGVTDEQLKHGTVRVFVGSFLLAAVMAVVLAAFIGDGGAGFGALAGLATGAAWVAAALGVNYLFERRSLMLFAINASYNIVTFTAMGAIIGAMQ